MQFEHDLLVDQSLISAHTKAEIDGIRPPLTPRQEKELEKIESIESEMHKKLVLASFNKKYYGFREPEFFPK